MPSIVEVSSPWGGEGPPLPFQVPSKCLAHSLTASERWSWQGRPVCRAEEKSAELWCPEMRGYNMVWSLPMGNAMWQDRRKREAGREWIEDYQRACKSF